ncbi:hypothetical protein V8G54_006154 [Vigna mungo]|uniref:Pentatricopeptide repeat-containing protein n=1 Tax=Vigna mungo TaxID=3915 RepID=A0AAQ3P1P2_VIGMU
MAIWEGSVSAAHAPPLPLTHSLCHSLHPTGPAIGVQLLPCSPLHRQEGNALAVYLRPKFPPISLCIFFFFFWLCTSPFRVVLPGLCNQRTHTHHSQSLSRLLKRNHAHFRPGDTKTMPSRSLPRSKLSTKLLNISISSLCKAKQISKAESVITDGIRIGVLPDAVTYNTLIDAYCRFASIDVAYSVLGRMREAGIPPDVVSYNSLMSGAVRKCMLFESLDLFEEMQARGVTPDAWSHNIQMHCLFKLGKPYEANGVFKKAVLCGEVHATTYNIMINGLCKNGYVSHALSLFRNLQRHGFVPQVLTYNALINGLYKAKRWKDAQMVLKEFGESDYEPNAITYTTVMKWSFRRGFFEQGLEILSEMRNLGFTFDGFAYCTVIAAMIKTGRMREAEEIIDIMVSTGIRPDLVSYNTLINLYCRQGRVDDALKLLDEIGEEGLECDQYTHTIIVDGLCKAGNFDGAQRHLYYMNTLGFGYNLVAYNCMIDGLGKAGHIDHAVKLFEEMEGEEVPLCLEGGYQVLRATQRAVLDGLLDIGFTNEARKLRSRIRLARLMDLCWSEVRQQKNGTLTCGESRDSEISEPLSRPQFLCLIEGSACHQGSILGYVTIGPTDRIVREEKRGEEGNCQIDKEEQKKEIMEERMNPVEGKLESMGLKLEHMERSMQAETAAIRKELQKLMRIMGGHLDGNSDGS